MDNPFLKLVEDVYRDSRSELQGGILKRILYTNFVTVFVILGHHYEHLGLLVAMQEKNLFEMGKWKRKKQRDSSSFSL